MPGPTCRAACPLPLCEPALPALPAPPRPSRASVYRLANCALIETAQVLPLVPSTCFCSLRRTRKIPQSKGKPSLRFYIALFARKGKKFTKNSKTLHCFCMFFQMPIFTIFEKEKKKIFLRIFVLFRKEHISHGPVLGPSHSGSGVF